MIQIPVMYVPPCDCGARVRVRRAARAPSGACAQTRATAYLPRSLIRSLSRSLAHRARSAAPTTARRRYQTAGWFVPTLFFAFIGLQAGFSGIFLSKAVSQMPGNRRLKERMEFSNIAKLLFPKW